MECMKMENNALIVISFNLWVLNTYLFLSILFLVFKNKYDQFTYLAYLTAGTTSP